MYSYVCVHEHGKLHIVLGVCDLRPGLCVRHVLVTLLAVSQVSDGRSVGSAEQLWRMTLARTQRADEASVADHLNCLGFSFCHRFEDTAGHTWEARLLSHPQHKF